MTVVKTIRTGFSWSLSQLAMMLAVIAWMFTVQVCLLEDAAAAPLVQTAHAYQSDDSTSNHQELDNCELALWRANVMVQPVATAASIKTTGMAPIPVAAIPELTLSRLAGATAVIFARTDIRPHRHARLFTTFWSHAPPTDRA